MILVIRMLLPCFEEESLYTILIIENASIKSKI